MTLAPNRPQSHPPLWPSCPHPIDLSVEKKARVQGLHGARDGHTGAYHHLGEQFWKSAASRLRNKEGIGQPAPQKKHSLPTESFRKSRTSSTVFPSSRSSAAGGVFSIWPPASGVTGAFSASFPGEMGSRARICQHGLVTRYLRPSPARVPQLLLRHHIRTLHCRRMGLLQDIVSPLPLELVPNGNRH